jgi:phosphopantothenoylcysteine decarboxylase/phosphopantothenate--cysteine ligase
MHTSMYENAVVQKNISELRRVGCEFIGPDEGALASGGTGLGRLADTETIVARVESILGLAR